MIGNSDDETNFPHKLLLNNRQVTTFRRVFANHTSTEVIQSRGFLGPLLKTGLPLMKSVIQPLAKSL